MVPNSTRRTIGGEQDASAREAPAPDRRASLLVNRPFTRTLYSKRVTPSGIDAKDPRGLAIDEVDLPVRAEVETRERPGREARIERPDDSAVREVEGMDAARLRVRHEREPARC